MTEPRHVFWCQVHDTIGNHFYCAYGEERNHRGLRVNCYMSEMLLVPLDYLARADRP